MSLRQFKIGYFVLAGLNSFATVFYSYYLYFFMRAMFGFGNQAELTLAAGNGCLYMVGAFWGGRFAQRFGYFRALKLGSGLMIASLGLGTQLTSAAGQVGVMMGMVLGMCFTWPTIEALVSEGETPAGLQQMIGLYNVVWAGTGAIAYFSGGAMLQHLGLKSMFFVPLAIQLVQLPLMLWLELALARQNRGALSAQGADLASAGDAVQPVPLNPRPIAKARTFLRMAWLANPFAYIATNTLIAVMPSVATKLGLSTTLAGFCCSVWCFARLAAFGGLWSWSGWHYRFRWLLAAYLALIVSFATILLVPNLAALVVAEIVFGFALGLIYSSSLFYSMDLSETKSTHGGIHEAAIGLGNFAGPAVGAASLYLLPQHPNSGAIAVSLLLLVGLGGLLLLSRR